MQGCDDDEYNSLNQPVQLSALILFTKHLHDILSAIAQNNRNTTSILYECVKVFSGLRFKQEGEPSERQGPICWETIYFN